MSNRPADLVGPLGLRRQLRCFGCGRLEDAHGGFAGHHELLGRADDMRGLHKYRRLTAPRTGCVSIIKWGYSHEKIACFVWDDSTVIDVQELRWVGKWLKPPSTIEAIASYCFLTFFRG